MNIIAFRRILAPFVLICAGFCSLVAVPALALVPAAPAPEPAAEAAAEPTIDDQADAGADSRIARRIEGIFGELPALADVGVTVNEGVVILSGKVPAEEDIARAEAIVSRISGVVTVDNGLTRDVSVDGSLSSLGDLTERIAGFTQMLPIFLLAVGVAILIGAIGYLLSSFSSIWRRLAPNGFLAELIASAIRFVFIVGGIVVGLDIIGAGALLGAVLGGAGVVGIALGFAMRDTIENYVASLMLSLRQPFRANDHVMIDEHEGRVIRLTSRATILMTLDGNHLRIPNATVFNAVLLNFTRNPQRRFDFELGIDADDDPEAARTLGRRMLAQLPYILDDPAPEVRTVEVGDSNIVLRFFGWIDQREADWFKARSRSIAVVKAALEKAGFALPEPIYRLRFDPRGAPLSLGSAQAEETSGQGLESQGAERDADKRAAAGDESAAKVKVPSATPALPENAVDDHADIRPDDEVLRMVEAERAAEPGENDLLDSSRPVE